MVILGLSEAQLPVQRHRRGRVTSVGLQPEGVEAEISAASTGPHYAKMRSTNPLERLFRELKRRTRVVGVFPNESSAQVLAAEITLRSSEEWAPRRYLTMDGLTEIRETQNPQLRESELRCLRPV